MSDVYIYNLVRSNNYESDDIIGPFSAKEIAESVLGKMHESRRSEWSISQELVDAQWSLDLDEWLYLKQEPSVYEPSKNCTYRPDRPKNVREFFKGIPTVTNKEIVEYKYELLCGPVITEALLQDVPSLRDYLDQKMREMLNG